jgi:hypothetical protein
MQFGRDTRRGSMSQALTERQAQEIEAFCDIARENGAVISLRELIALADIESNELELATAFRSHSKLSSRFLLESGYVLERVSGKEKDAAQLVAAEERRRERAFENLRRARAFGRTLRGGLLVSVSGGNSYLSAAEDDDIDFFCVTRTNGMWPFMVRALILARIHRLANKEVPALCFSCVMDLSWATSQFRERQDPIFARDALTAKVITGERQYRTLLEDAVWMKEFFPTFYEMRLSTAQPADGVSPSEEPPHGADSRVLNSFLFHTVGAFLRIKSWALNRRLTKAGWRSAIFETKVGRGHYIFESNGYRGLRKMYGSVEKAKE